jgi:hypothetical protein
LSSESSTTARFLRFAGGGMTSGVEFDDAAFVMSQLIGAFEIQWRD